VDDVHAAFFDLDKTVIAKASIAAFGRPLRRQGLISRRMVARAIAGQLMFMYFGADEERLAKIRESMLTVTKGWDREQISNIVRETLIETIEPLIYAEALALMEQHRSDGHRIYLVSASPEEIVQPLAELLGVDGAIATKAKIDEDGCYTGEMEFYNYGPNKAVAMGELAERNGIDLSQSFAYSDSATDQPMLEAVGHPVAVNPDRALAKVAREREWEILNFTKPVRLRDRVSRRTPLFTAVVAVVGAIGLVFVRGGKSHHSTRA
jgi:HAD superfamily hydrolase (TIGR01490 family)